MYSNVFFRILKTNDLFLSFIPHWTPIPTRNTPTYSYPLLITLISTFGLAAFYCVNHFNYVQKTGNARVYLSPTDTVVPVRQLKQIYGL